MSMRKKPLFRAAAAVVLAGAAVVAFGVFGVHTLVVNRTVEDKFASDGAQLVASGSFHDVVHKGQSGEARVYRMQDGSHVLRLENLKIDNGPALHVLLLAADDANDNATVKSAPRLDLGDLKGNQGSQTYPIPSFDPERHRAVTIWCDRFDVNFATAPLRKR